MVLDGDEVRNELKRGGRPYPLSARRRAVAFAEQERRRGVGLELIATRLGIARMTLTSWMRSPLVPVEIVPVPKVAGVAASLAAHDVHSGIRIEGLDLEAAVSLLKAFR